MPAPPSPAMTPLKSAVVARPRILGPRIEKTVEAMAKITTTPIEIVYGPR